ncbi:unnamed protein product [Calypogeia fissa]
MLAIRRHRRRETSPGEMAHRQRLAPVVCCNLQSWFAAAIGFAILCSCVVTAAVAPTTNCYALDVENHLYDLTDLYGHEFEKEIDMKTYTLRFCKDFQERSKDSGYVSFGSYEAETSANSVSKGISFIHDYRHGDLNKCELHGTEFNGRETDVSIICGESCPNAGACKDPVGCICSVTFDDTEKPCAASVVLVVNCPNPGPRVINGFTVGFSPRGKEVVANGLTQWGYENDQHADYSFDTSQLQVFLYFSAPSQVATELGKPTIATSPSKGLEVQLSGSAASGTAPTTLTPSLLGVQWRCEAARMFVVTVTVPVNGYDPIVFSLLKLCDSMQTNQANASSGWATFGVLSCIFFVMTTMCCCAGFLYGTRVENKHGLEALPGIGVLSSCLDAASSNTGEYRRAEEGSSIIGDYSLRDGSNATPRGGLRTGDGRYGSVR